MIGKKIEKNIVTIALKVLYVKKGKKYLAYVSKHNSNREKQVVLLITPKRKGLRYLAEKHYQHY